MPRFRHWLGVPFCIAIAFGLLAASPVAAFVPPIGSTSKCADVAAGWVGAAAPSGDGFTFNGTLNWQMCVINAESEREAKAQLSSTADLHEYDRFFGTIQVRLQLCTPLTHSTISYNDVYYDGIENNPNYTGYDHGTLKAGRYNFTSLATPWIGGTPPGTYRVKVTTYSGQVIGHNLAPTIMLSSDGPGGSASFTTPCWSI
jgi:hypothetical protein